MYKYFCMSLFMAVCCMAQSTSRSEFTVNVISGFLKGEVYQGWFSYESSILSGQGREKIKVSDIHFNCRGDVYGKNDFDSVPELEFVDGKFKDLYLVGGPQTKRFGINAGFGRYQFGRPSESFIPQGQSYFGYLDERTYVEGAGTIKYQVPDIKPQPQEKTSPKPQLSGMIYYDLTVKIISGSLEGQVFYGSFSYDASKLSGAGKETIAVSEIFLSYQGEKYTSFDDTAKLEFIDGQLKDLYLVGGPQTKRFGINAGFNRYQFNRSCEDFITQGKSYFGYLDQYTYVDGAGTIEYQQVISHE